MTRIKDQSSYTCSGLCYIYAPLGALEAVANLYYNVNPHIDYDLSIQHVLDCDNYNGTGLVTQCQGGYPLTTSNFVKNNPEGYPLTVIKGQSEGVYLDEECYERQNQPNSQCQEDTFQLSTQYKFDYYSNTCITPYENPDVNDVKLNLITKGPMCATLLNYLAPGNAHAMALVGYGRIDIGDVYRLDNGQVIIAEDGDNNIGKTYWIYKNSYGYEYGDGGYLSIINTNNNPTYLIYYNPPFSDLKLTTQAEPEVYDKDKDGYFNWGIDDTYQPSGTIKDSDDSDPRLGPFDENYYSVPVKPIMTVKENGTNIPDNSYYTFYDESLSIGGIMALTFTITNEGDAQLNLDSNAFFPTVNLSNGTDFDLTYDVGLIELPMDGSTTFTITFTLNQAITEEVKTTVTIRTDEIDMDGFSFELVFTDCEQTANTEYIYPGTTNWQGNDIKYSDIVVKAGATLNITGEYAFSQNANIYIESCEEDKGEINGQIGGIVIIDGGRLTSLCTSENGQVLMYGVMHQKHSAMILITQHKRHYIREKSKLLTGEKLVLQKKP